MTLCQRGRRWRLAVACMCALSTCGLAPLDTTAAEPPTRLVLLLRHAEAAYVDAEGRPVANTDVVGLTGHGVDQVRHLAEWLRALGLDRFDQWLVSPLPRAQQTARLLADGLGTAPAELRTVEALRELPPGDGAGVARSRAAALAELERLRLAGNWQTVLLVAHGGIHRALLARALTGQEERSVRAGLDNACLHLLELRPDGEWLVRGSNLCPGGPVTGRPAPKSVLAAPNRL
jgi:probable phosphoglycerate mutase